MLRVDPTWWRYDYLPMSKLWRRHRLSSAFLVIGCSVNLPTLIASAGSSARTSLKARQNYRQVSAAGWQTGRHQFFRPLRPMIPQNGAALMGRSPLRLTMLHTLDSTAAKKADAQQPEDLPEIDVGLVARSRFVDIRRWMGWSRKWMRPSRIPRDHSGILVLFPWLSKRQG